MRSLAVTCGVLALVLSACSASTRPGSPAVPPRSTAGRTPSAQPLACPTAATAVTPQARRSPLLGRHPAAARACLTGEPASKRTVLGAGVELSRGVATTLARLIDEATPASAALAAKCVPDAVGWLTRFAYPSGVIDVVTTRCRDHVVLVGGRPYRLNPVVAEYLAGAREALGGDASGDGFRPDVMGASLHTAAARVRAAGLTLALAGSAVDASPPGTILLQYPANDRQISVIVAVHRSRPCRRGQLGVQYRPGAAGAGNDFGAITVRNTSPWWCELTGPIRLTAIPLPDVVNVGVSADLELSPGASPAAPRRALAATQLVAVLSLTAGYRDDRDGSLCSPHWIVPEAWRLDTAAGRLVVPNGRATADAEPLGTGGLITCRGRFAATTVELAVT